MKYEEARFSGFQRPDLIRYVLRECVEIPPEKMHLFEEMKAWCQEHCEEERPGSILMEAMDGWLDYFDGDWGHFPDDFDEGRYLFWFFRKEDRALFTLTWL